MSSLSFNSIAANYDATRGYPPGVIKQIMPAIKKAAEATSETRFLEIGVGTGRIALPLASLGQNYTGIDISENMLQVLVEKLQAAGWQPKSSEWGEEEDELAENPHEVCRFVLDEPAASMRLVNGDITRLPFGTETFDVVAAIHILHLVDGWEAAMREVMRVVKPGGLFIICWDADMRDNQVTVNGAWRKIVNELMKQPFPLVGATDGAVINWLRARGLNPEHQAVCRWKVQVSPRQQMDLLQKRLWSRTLLIPDDIFRISMERLQRWAHEYYRGNLDQPYFKEREFILSKTRLA